MVIFSNCDIFIFMIRFSNVLPRMSQKIILTGIDICIYFLTWKRILLLLDIKLSDMEINRGIL